MNFEWDENKRRINITKHGLDFVDAWRIFEFQTLVFHDDREDYGEPRYLAIGLLDDRIVSMIYSQPNEFTRRIISLRKAIKLEQRQYENYLRDELGIR